MKQSVKKVVDAASRLPEIERARVAEELLATLPAGEAEDDIDAAWATEIERRTREIDRGLVEPVPWADVRRQAGRRPRG